MNFYFIQEKRENLLHTLRINGAFFTVICAYFFAIHALHTLAGDRLRNTPGTNVITALFANTALNIHCALVTVIRRKDETNG